MSFTLGNYISRVHRTKVERGKRCGDRKPVGHRPHTQKNLLTEQLGVLTKLVTRSLKKGKKDQVVRERGVVRTEEKYGKQ